MKKIIVFLTILFSLSVAYSQKVYFIYLQSDNQQPFYVRMGEKIYHAATSGYLVLPKLRDSTYALNIGIEGSQTKEQLFSLTVNKKDQGFLLKDFGEEGWGLFNLQSFDVIKPESVTATGVVLTEKKETNSFNELLAKAANDSTLIEKQSNVKKEEKKGISDSGIHTTDEMKKTETIIGKKGNDILLVGVLFSSKVVKHSESSTTEGFGLIFYDVLTNGTIDTVKILIPETKSIRKTEIKKEEKNFQDNIEDTTKRKADIGYSENGNAKKRKSDTVISTIIINSDSSEIATEDNVSIFKNRMVFEKNVVYIINEAAKTFSTKCLTTLQIKDISSLFITDDGKYKFFDAAYSHVSDIATFGTLQSELKEDYFIRRFKAKFY